METVPHNHTQKKNLYLQHLSCTLEHWSSSQGFEKQKIFSHSTKTLWCCEFKAFNATYSNDAILL